MCVNLDYKEHWFWNELLDLGFRTSYDIVEHWIGTINYIMEQ